MQSVLFFVLGFLSAGFIALTVAPAVWRRASFLTRKRIEASVPLTLSEIQADKDRMRAEFAMATRRLEINFKTFREKAAAQIVEINRNREELKQLMSERSERHEALTKLEAQAGEVRAELRKREDQLQVLAEQLAQAEQLLEQRAEEIEKLGRMYDEATFTASNRQTRTCGARRRDRKALGRYGDAAQRTARDRPAQQGSRDGEPECARIAENRTGSGRLPSKHASSGCLPRSPTARRRSTAATGRWRGCANTVKSGSATEEELNAQLAAVQAEKVKLEGEHVALKQQLATVLSGARIKELEKTVTKISADRDLLEERLKLLTRENRKLKVDIAVHERTKSEEWSGEGRASAHLREQMNDLAAEVVRLTATLDGPDSPIAKAIGMAPRGASDNGAGKVVSLADRVRALQNAASAE